MSRPSTRRTHARRAHTPPTRSIGARPRQRSIRSLDDLHPDPLNANRGTDRGRAALLRSLQAYGPGRSIVIDKRGRIIGGHKTVEQAKQMGLPITVVPSDGHRLVVVQRVDLDVLTDPRARDRVVCEHPADDSFREAAPAARPADSR